MVKRSTDRPAESQRDKFIRTARELECDEDPDAFKRVVQKIVKPERKSDTIGPQEHGGNK
jgi:hypothetical protein